MHGTYLKTNCTNARYIHQSKLYKCTVLTSKQTVKLHGAYIKANCKNARYIHQNKLYKCTVLTSKQTVKIHGTHIKTNCTNARYIYCNIADPTLNRCDTTQFTVPYTGNKYELQQAIWTCCAFINKLFMIHSCTIQSHFSQVNQFCPNIQAIIWPMYCPEI